ncbi:uL30 family ribosomal protein [Candidatus Woesearchaeota archaeon]|nr:uL30 family ribosomal protein [Candidatus Woesearchaeota archaeon]
MADETVTAPPAPEPAAGTQRKASPAQKQEDQDLVAVVRVRGITGIKKDIKDTLAMLRLHRKNQCAIYPKTPTTMGMIKKVKDFVTYGELSPAVRQKLDARGKGGPYALSSPRKGYGRKGIKTGFSIGGALGYRGAKINDLIERML